MKRNLKHKMNKLRIEFKQIMELKKFIWNSTFFKQYKIASVTISQDDKYEINKVINHHLE
jgi:hypothetical protein